MRIPATLTLAGRRGRRPANWQKDSLALVRMCPVVMVVGCLSLPTLLAAASGRFREDRAWPSVLLLLTMLLRATRSSTRHGREGTARKLRKMHRLAQWRGLRRGGGSYHGRGIVWTQCGQRYGSRTNENRRRSRDGRIIIDGGGTRTN